MGVMSQVLCKPQPQGEDGGDEEEEDELVGLAGYEDGPESSDAELDSGPEEGGETGGRARSRPPGARRGVGCGSGAPRWGRGAAGLQTAAGGRRGAGSDVELKEAAGGSAPAGSPTAVRVILPLGGRGRVCSVGPGRWVGARAAGGVGVSGRPWGKCKSCHTASGRGASDP